MYVCVCHAVTDRDIQRAVRNGASSIRHLRDQLGVATQCGACACHAKSCLREAMTDAGEPCVGSSPLLAEALA